MKNTSTQATCKKCGIRTATEQDGLCDVCRQKKHLDMVARARETDVTRICPSCGRVLKEEYVACPHCGKDLTGKAEAAKQEGEKEKAALYGVIGGFICLLIGWFIFGFIFSLVAAGLGWNGIKQGSSGTKVLGIICLIVGIIFFFLSLIAY